MKFIRFERLLLVGVVILLTVMPVGAAWAGPPERETWTLEWDMPLADCGNFVVMEVLSAEIRATHFYDKDGEWVRTQEHWTADGYVYNGSDPTIWLPEKPVRNMGIWRESSSTIVGPLIKIPLPGEGMIYHQVGRIVWDSEGNLIHQAGQNDLYGGNIDALCAALE